ncbi:MAG: energy transducer TonB [Vicingaceae bacterium]
MELKKNPEADIQKKRPLYFEIGLVIVLAGVLIAFEWKSFEGEGYNLGQLNLEDIEEEIIPITQQNQPPPPPPPPPQVQEILNIVEDDVEIEDELEIDSEADEDTEIEIIQYEEVVEEEEIFTVVEQMPSFPGGTEKLYKYMYDNIRYPEVAKEAGIQGTVYISFVVEKDGTIADVKVLRGIPGGKMCDDEAVRVVKKMPNWSPGKQRGKSVRVSYNLPVKFRLR